MSTVIENIGYLRSKCEEAFYMLSKHTDKEIAENAAKDVVKSNILERLQVYKELIPIAQGMLKKAEKDDDALGNMWKGAQQARLNTYNTQKEILEQQLELIQLI